MGSMKEEEQRALGDSPEKGYHMIMLKMIKKLPKKYYPNMCRYWVVFYNVWVTFTSKNTHINLQYIRMRVIQKSFVTNYF